jgi:ubiquinone/menaquinone biosynthesis C-methylase UbiE
MWGRQEGRAAFAWPSIFFGPPKRDGNAVARLRPCSGQSFALRVESGSMDEEKTLSVEQAKAFYDRLGSVQDWQSFYEDPAVTLMVERGDFRMAHSLVEFGCGTGRLAERLLAEFLPSDAKYLGLDVSTTMCGLARGRLKQFGERAEVRQTDGSTSIDAGDESFDRFFSTYVFDLMSRERITSLVAEAHRVLKPDGLLCAVSLTHGRSTIAKLVSKTWAGIWSYQPSLLGGCRPIELLEFISHERWQVSHLEVVSSFALSSEVLVASKR